MFKQIQFKHLNSPELCVQFGTPRSYQIWLHQQQSPRLLDWTSLSAEVADVHQPKAGVEAKKKEIYRQLIQTSTGHVVNAKANSTVTWCQTSKSPRSEFQTHLRGTHTNPGWWAAHQRSTTCEPVHDQRLKQNAQKILTFRYVIECYSYCHSVFFFRVIVVCHSCPSESRCRAA